MIAGGTALALLLAVPASAEEHCGPIELDTRFDLISCDAQIGANTGEDKVGASGAASVEADRDLGPAQINGASRVSERRNATTPGYTSEGRDVTIRGVTVKSRSVTTPSLDIREPIDLQVAGRTVRTPSKAVDAHTLHFESRRYGVPTFGLGLSPLAPIDGGSILMPSLPVDRFRTQPAVTIEDLRGWTSWTIDRPEEAVAKAAELRRDVRADVRETATELATSLPSAVAAAVTGAMPWSAVVAMILASVGVGSVLIRARGSLAG